MSTNTKEIFDRMDIQQIRSFLLEGLDAIEICNISYEQRLKESSKLMLKRLEAIYGENANELSNAADEFYAALNVYSDVYTEIGIKAGARLLNQLLYENE
jgi:hypothetical protein